MDLNSHFWISTRALKLWTRSSYDFVNIFFFFWQFAWKGTQVIIAVLSSDLKYIFCMKKSNNIGYSLPFPYLIDANWLIGLIFRVKWLNQKSQL